MPMRNKTGPLSQGSKTGRGMGTCQPSGKSKTQTNRNTNEMMQNFFGNMGRGFGFGRGMGRCWGFRRGFAFADSFSTPSKQQEMEMLQDELRYLNQDMKSVEKRLDELKKSKI